MQTNLRKLSDTTKDMGGYDADDGIDLILKADEFATIGYDAVGDVTYTISEPEVPENYKPQQQTMTGTVTKGTGLWVDYVNDYTVNPDGYSLILSKQIGGPDTGGSYTFNVALDNLDGAAIAHTVTGTATVMEKDDPGRYTVTLAHGDSVTFTGMPAGYSYLIRESDDPHTDHVTIDAPESAFTEGFTVTAFGVITPNVDITYTNIIRTGGLSVTKTVTGDGDINRDWNFTVTLDSTTVNGTFGNMTFTDGMATFTLKHGESKTATGLPAGIGYRIVETEADQDGYITTAENGTGTIPVEGGNASSWQHSPTIRSRKSPKNRPTRPARRIQGIPTGRTLRMEGGKRFVQTE